MNQRKISCRHIAFAAMLAGTVLFLGGCGGTIDARQVTLINGLMYKLNANDPFTGTVKNAALTAVPAHLFPLAREGQSTAPWLGASEGCTFDVTNGELADGTLICLARGNKLIELSYKNSRKNGTEKSWDPSTGNLYAEADWENGLKSGTEKFYNLNTGKLAVSTSYSNGKLDGKLNQFNEKGDLIHTTTFSAGIKNGPEQIRDSATGDLLVDLDWVTGKSNGIVKYGKTSSGEPLTNMTIKDGIINGRVVTEAGWGPHSADDVKLINNVLTDTVPRDEVTFKNGKIDGEYKTFDTENSKSTVVYLKKLSRYKDGRLDGISQEFNQDGSIRYQELYADGRSVESLATDNDKNPISATKTGKQDFNDCIDQMIAAYRKEAGDDAVISADMTSEFEDKCKG